MNRGSLFFREAGFCDRESLAQGARKKPAQKEAPPLVAPSGPSREKSTRKAKRDAMP